MLTSADWALLRLVEGKYGSVSPTFWECFGASWGDRLRAACEGFPHEANNSAFEELKREHAAEARPNLGRVHHSWFVRGLKDESPAVQRSVVANASGPLREQLRTGLGLSLEDLEPDQPAQPDALRWVLALWTERLVGDRPDRLDDPQVIRGLTGLGARSSFRLVRTTGLVKWALAGALAPGVRGRERARLAYFEQLLQASAPGLRKWAEHDVGNLDRSKPHPLARLGMVTISRLLDDAEPYRVRWALQHVPYPVAKFMRSLMSSRAKRDPAVLRCESEMLRIAWDRLRHEGLLRQESGETT